MKLFVRSTLYLIVFISMFFPVSLLYADTKPDVGVDYFTNGLLDRAASIKAAESVTKQKYPDADIAMVNQHNLQKYSKDGTYVQWYETYTKILTEKGRRSMKTLASYFTLPYNTTEYKLVEIIHQDGTVTQIDIKANVSVMIQSGQMSDNIYNPNAKIMKISLPRVNVGDVVHYVLYDDFKKVTIPGHWSEIVSLESTDPILRYEITFIAPEKKPLEHMIVKSQIPGTVFSEQRVEGRTKIYKWIVKNVPQAFPEPDMPPLYSQIQRLRATTVKDWETISRWYWNLCLPHMEDTTPEMEKTVAALVEGLTSRQEKIRAVFDYVSQDIRYMGLTLEENSPGYEPHPVRLTFERKAGVCRDKAVLLTSMLRMAQIEAYPALMRNGPKVDETVPMSIFNHAITAVLEPDGSYLLMDSTDENTRELLPGYLNDQNYLVATPAGDFLRTSPLETAEKNMVFVKTTGKMDKHGKIKGNMIIKFEGINDNVYRGMLWEKSIEERKIFFENLASGLTPDSWLTDYSILPKNLNDTSIPLKVQIEFTTGDVRIKGKNTMMLSLPYIDNSVGMVHFLLGKMGLKKRKYPIFTEYACGVEETLDIEIDQPGLAVSSLPVYQNTDQKGYRWKAFCDFDGKTFSGRRTFTLKLPEYAPDQYLALKKTVQNIEEDMKKKPVFSICGKEGTECAKSWYESFDSDAVILKDELTCDIEDIHTWTETLYKKIKILTYAGKKDFSDAYFSYNPIWETLEVKEAFVRLESGETTKVKAQEINIMDKPWVASASRYPGGKTLVINFPSTQVGCTVEYKIVKKRTKQPFFGANISFSSYYPILEKSFTIIAPESLDLKINKTDCGTGIREGTDNEYCRKVISVKQTSDGGKKVSRFSGQKLEPVQKEENLPPWLSFNPVVMVSAGSWKAYAVNLGNFLKNACDGQAETEKKAAELAEGLTTDLEKIIAVRDFAAIHIRSVPVSIKRLPFESISKADTILKDGYGNATDRAVLLFTLLDSLGLNPEFAISSMLSKIPVLQKPFFDFPQNGFLRKAMVRVKSEKEGYIWLNDTNQYSMPGTTSADGYTALLIPAGRIVPIKSLNEDLKNRSEVFYNIKLSENGDAKIERIRKIYGTRYGAFKKRFVEISPEDRRRRHLSLIASISRNAEADGEYITKYDTYPAVEQLSVKVKKWATRQQDYLYFHIPGITGGLVSTGREKRVNPLYRYWTVCENISIDINFPENIESVEMILPEKSLFRIEGAGYVKLERTPFIPGQPLQIRQLSRIDPVVIMPWQYPGYLATSRQMSHPDMRMILFRMKGK
ncbi:DUF3857 domain-containing protein [Desulfobacterales bacterium HSG16]|nr:DUF3857 domain-containing protein [Desulfobacterales bacterium HSG16]